MIGKLPLVPLVLAFCGTVPYMFYWREWQLEADAVAVFVVLALLFSAAQWGLKKRRSG
jgi:hypothetical protein